MSKSRTPKVLDHLPDADPEEVRKLMDLLWEALNMNDMACCRVLSISRGAWKKYQTNPPTWAWWPTILREAIIMTIASLTAKRGITVEHRRNMNSALRRIAALKDLQFDLQSRIVSTGGAEAYLMKLLAKKPRRASWIFKAANCGGYSKSSLERASRALEVVKKQKGFGDENESIWSLPSEKHYSRDLSRPTRKDQMM